MRVATEKQDSGEHLDHEIAHRDRFSAVAAFSQENQPAQHRQIVIQRNLMAAVGTRRPWRDHRLPQGEAVDTHIQEAAEGKPQGEDRGCKKRVQVS